MLNDVSGREREEADAALIARARHDRAAFAEIYRLYARRVYAFCRAHSRTREEAEDLTAQTFERALRAVGRYEDRGARMSSWLLRIAVNAAADRARQGGREIAFGTDLPADDTCTRAGQEETARWVEDWERATWVRAHLAALPPDQRRAVRLRFFEDHSFAEVAAAMGRSEGAVKQLAWRALKVLRARMDEEAIDDTR